MQQWWSYKNVSLIKVADKYWYGRVRLSGGMLYFDVCQTVAVGSINFVCLRGMGRLTKLRTTFGSRAKWEMKTNEAFAARLASKKTSKSLPRKDWNSGLIFRGRCLGEPVADEGRGGGVYLHSVITGLIFFVSRTTRLAAFQWSRARCITTDDVHRDLQVCSSSSSWGR